MSTPSEPNWSSAHHDSSRPQRDSMPPHAQPFAFNPQPSAGPPQPPQMYPGQPGYFPYQAPPRSTNGLAIASMVLGILWIAWIGSVLALIFGYIARKQIRERHQGGDGMATTGIVLGWIGVGFLVVRSVVVVFARM